MKRAVAAVLLIMMMTVMFSSVAMGATKVTKIYLGDRGASLRDSPAGEKIGSVHGKTWLKVHETKNGWYLVTYNGQNGWVSDKQVAQREYKKTGKESSSRTTAASSKKNKKSNVPYIAPRVYGKDQKDWSVIWVQTNLKAAGWYQGDQWKITGNVGKHTMSEIQSFMHYMGNPYHTGVVDQSVIDALCEYLGDNVVYVDPNAKTKKSTKGNGATKSKYTTTCRCGRVLTGKVTSSEYYYDKDGHWLVESVEYTCTSCGDQYHFDECGAWTAHKYSEYDNCVTCGYIHDAIK